VATGRLAHKGRGRSTRRQTSPLTLARVHGSKRDHVPLLMNPVQLSGACCDSKSAASAEIAAGPAATACWTSRITPAGVFTLLCNDEALSNAQPAWRAGSLIPPPPACNAWSSVGSGLAGVLPWAFSVMFTPNTVLNFWLGE